MSGRAKTLHGQLVVRVTPELHDALRADATANGRTVAQSVRWHLEYALDLR